ncbi:MAG: helix-turn-helix transcriptional regulator [Firmicutes bacterium]|nr:helix-turn-helix transcriptional regulator [Bacillota bacterium]
MTIGEKIRDLRLRNELTLKELANNAGISLSYLGDIEKNRTNPSIETLKNISKALNKPIGYFLDETPAEKSDPNEQFFLRANKLSEEGKEKLWEFLDFVELWEADNKKKKYGS